MRAALVDVVTRYAALMRQSARGNYGHTLLAQKTRTSAAIRSSSDLKDRRVARRPNRLKIATETTSAFSDGDESVDEREPDDRRNTAKLRYAGRRHAVYDDIYQTPRRCTRSAGGSYPVSRIRKSFTASW